MKVLYALRPVGQCVGGHWHFEVWWRVIIMGEGFEMKTWVNEECKVELS